MESGIRKKYNSALLHLERMKKESITDHEFFRTNLEAFVETSRNVTYIMQKEFKHRAGFNEWYKEIQKNMDNDDVFSFFNKKRVTSVHKKPVETVLTGCIPKSLSFAIVGQPDDIVTEDTKTLATISPIQYSRRFGNHPKGYSTEEVISLCEKYIAKLGLIVDECEVKFS